MVVLSVVCTAIAHTLWVRGLAHFKATTTGTFSCLAPVMGALLALIFLKEPLTGRIVLGGSIILCVAIFETRRHSK